MTTRATLLLAACLTIAALDPTLSPAGALPVQPMEAATAAPKQDLGRIYYRCGYYGCRHRYSRYRYYRPYRHYRRYRYYGYGYRPYIGVGGFGIGL